MAIYNFHKVGNEEAARRYLVDLMDRFSLNNAGRRTAAEYELEGYFNWCRRENPIVIARKLRVELDIGAGQLLCGEVPRVDLVATTGGYRAILLGAPAADWRDELRMPLLQRAVAQRLSRDEQDVAVGVQYLDGEGLEVVQFSTAQIENRMRRVRALSMEVSRRLAQ